MTDSPTQNGREPCFDIATGSKIKFPLPDFLKENQGEGI